MIKVLVSGAAGKMGRTVMNAVGNQDDMQVVCAYDPFSEDTVVLSGGKEFTCVADLEEAIKTYSPDVMVDFTHPDAVSENVEKALSLGVHCVVGTTGESHDNLKEIYERAAKDGANLFIAPNFTTGAVLMMEFAKKAAAFFEDAEIIEYHHNNKADSPSGTALLTAQMIDENRMYKSTSPGKESEAEGCEGARGALVHNTPIHSVRSDGFVANQEVILGSPGQTLTIHHVSHDRNSYMPGVLLAVRNVSSIDGVLIGLDRLMDL